ncbi:hypothetical protein LPJ38_32065 [Bradyrhizobium daqingense]|uniref:Uncharacterized protein n=1 Tax=Bradyrhizobium daqingense TaxID=993502 RepID=A0A562LQK7_9BRAD|nr:hypothetical protein [Bradyrhizobium daqingense]TWI09911.1 hypothetical protein IQ17_00991 [Bradyrhizobium daqingense]UFS92900.1 hypothetical protein LPJ38_32065 [Bradyrhizobium daqingense]
MKLGFLSAGLLGILAAVVGQDRLSIGEQFVMSGKAKADDRGKDSGEAGRAPSMPMARDPSVAVAEEYEAARRTGTREAFELFIARHGDAPLAEQARAELKRLSR